MAWARRLKVKAASIVDGCRNMAVLVEGTMHEREGCGMREELVCRLCVLSAGRMVAEERCITQLMTGSGNARRISGAS